MAHMLVVVSLAALQMGMAVDPCAPQPVAPGVAPVAYTTTPAGLTPLQQGLIGAGVSVAGLAAIGGIAGAMSSKKKVTTLAPTHPPVVHPTHKPVIVTTTLPATTAVVAPRATEEPGSSPGWLLPLLLGLLLLCCLLGIIGYFCMGSKRAVKKSTKKKPAPKPANTRDLEVAPAAEVAPLMAGHWEQPMQTVPVTTAQSSYVPRAVAAPTYAMAAPTYAPAPTYAVAPRAVETVAPTYAMQTVPVTTAQSSYVPASTYAVAAPTYVETAAPTYSMASTPIVETVAPTYAVAPAAVMETVAPTYAVAPSAVMETVAPTYAVGATPMMAATAPTALVGTTGYSMPGYATTGATGYSMPGYATTGYAGNVV